MKVTIKKIKKTPLLFELFTRQNILYHDVIVVMHHVRALVRISDLEFHCHIFSRKQGL